MLSSIIRPQEQKLPTTYERSATIRYGNQTKEWADTEERIADMKMEAS